MRPIIDLLTTGANIRRLRYEREITVAQIQNYLELQTPRAIYKWQRGDALPDIENLLGISIMFAVPINEILKTEHRESG